MANQTETDLYELITELYGSNCAILIVQADEPEDLDTVCEYVDSLRTLTDDHTIYFAHIPTIK